jgi:radical SAM/Cys-rich protein
MESSVELENGANVKCFDFKGKLDTCGVELSPLGIKTLQLNITRLCNQTCVHCHVDASPRRREMMNDDVLERCLQILHDNACINTVDITGGAPELHPRFQYLVATARAIGKRVIIRHNLTVTLDPHPITKESLAYLPQFFADHSVELISSLPYYQEYFTDQQRGKGVFEKSIASLQLLNHLGYGRVGSNLVLNLVYNPIGSFLPAPQHSLEQEFKREMKEHFGVDFNQLYVLTNMPIHRFKAQLRRLNDFDGYMEKLVSAFSVSAANNAMCRTLVSVSHNGTLYDCDFNQMLHIPISHQEQSWTVFNFDEKNLRERKIQFASHCFGCTAGQGSSCGGKTSEL